MPPRAPGRARDGRDPRSRSSASRRSAARGRSRRSSSSRRRGRAGSTRGGARRRRADDAGRLPLPRPQRHRPLRREGARSAGAASLVLRGRPPAAGGRGGARRARAGRVARARLGARGVARGASPHPRAAPARERARRPPAVVPPAARRALGRRRRADPLRADREQAPRAARGPRARRLRRRRPRRARSPPLRARLRRLARDLRFEDAAGCAIASRRSRRSPRGSRSSIASARAELCVLAPAREPGFWRAFVVARGRVAARTIPRGAAGRLEIETALATASGAEPSLAPEDAAELLVVVRAFSASRRPRFGSSAAARAEILAAWSAVAPCLTMESINFADRLARGRHAQAEPARRRPRPAARPAADGAARRGRARAGCRGVVGRALLQGDRRRGRARTSSP